MASTFTGTVSRVNGHGQFAAEKKHTASGRKNDHDKEVIRFMTALLPA